MPLFRESQYLMHLFITLLLCWLGWLCGLALGQVSEAFTGSANFSNIQITCIGNLAALIKFLLLDKGSFGPRYSLSGKLIRPMSYSPVRELSTYGEEELRNCSIVILSKQKTPSDSMRRFLEYISDDSDVLYIFLQYRPLPLQSVEEVTIEICSHGGRCGCIVFDTVEAIKTKLARQIPGTAKRLSASLYLLPSLRCLQNGCHGCNRGLLHVENDIFREGDSQVESPAAVCELLDCKSIHKEGTCLCIPVRSANEDEWTNRLIEFFKPDDKEFRGAVIRKGGTNASSALQNYKNGNGECDAVEKYKLASLYALPRLAIPLINLVLTFWLKVDAISSFLLAIQAVKSFSPKNEFFSPFWFLARACVKSNANKTNICQVLFFRSSGLQNAILSSSLAFCVFCICCVTWMFLVALEGGPYNKWFHTHSMPPSTHRILVILVGICIALVMDALDVKLYLKIRRRYNNRYNISMICSVIVLEILSIVVGSTIIGVMGIQAVGRWIYSALHGLALIKLFAGRQLHKDSDGEPNWWYRSCGLYIASSGFLLNAILAGVRAKWEF